MFGRWYVKLLPEGLGTGEPRAGFPDLQAQLSLFGLLPPPVAANPPTHAQKTQRVPCGRPHCHASLFPASPLARSARAVRRYSRSGLVLLCVCGGGQGFCWEIRSFLGTSGLTIVSMSPCHSIDVVAYPLPKGIRRPWSGSGM